MLTTWRRRGLRPVLGVVLLITALFLTQQSAIAGSTTVQVGDIWFCNETFQGGACETTINVGEMVVWEAGEKFRVLARNQVGELSYATPAVANGAMYIRTLSHLLSVGGG